jgi:general stress protein 26
MSKKHLKNSDALTKLKTLAENIDFTMMETNLGNEPSHIIPMRTKEVDNEGSIWFLSNKNSNHISHIEANNSIQLIYAKPSNMEFMNIYGKAFVCHDETIIKRYYNDSDNAWFDGITDPNIAVIKVIPKDAHYWEIKSGKKMTIYNTKIDDTHDDQQDLIEHGNLMI